MLQTNLTKYRIQKGLSKLQLSKISGVSRETIKQIELYGKEEVLLTTLEKLAKPLGVTVVDLIK